MVKDRADLNCEPQRRSHPFCPPPPRNKYLACTVLYGARRGKLVLVLDVNQATYANRHDIDSIFFLPGGHLWFAPPETTTNGGIGLS